MTESAPVRPNCYKCIHRRDLPGDAHSSCAHPNLPPLSPIIEILGGFYGRQPSAPASGPPIAVRGDTHGIRSGWFMWPVNFDPVWLLECSGFTPKAEPTGTVEGPAS